MKIQLKEDTSALMPPEIEKLYLQAFPPEERRTWNPRPKGLHLYRIMSEAGEFLGFITTWQLPEEITYIEHFAILPRLRGQGIGSEVLGQLCGNILLEVELPENSEARRRIDLYSRHGFHAATDISYEQPPYSPSLPAVPMLILYRLGDSDAASEKSMNLPEAINNLKAIVYGQ